MIIGIPTDDGKSVSEHFGRPGYFAIIEKGEKEAVHRLVENPHDKEGNEQSSHGRLLKTLVENKAEKAICFNLNPRTLKNLNSLKIEVQKSEPTEIDRLFQSQ